MKCLINANMVVNALGDTCPPPGSRGKSEVRKGKGVLVLDLNFEGAGITLYFQPTSKSLANLKQHINVLLQDIETLEKDPEYQDETH